MQRRRAPRALPGQRAELQQSEVPSTVIIDGKGVVPQRFVGCTQGGQNQSHLSQDSLGGPSPAMPEKCFGIRPSCSSCRPHSRFHPVPALFCSSCPDTRSARFTRLWTATETRRMPCTTQVLTRSPSAWPCSLRRLFELVSRNPRGLVLITGCAPRWAVLSLVSLPKRGRLAVMNPRHSCYRGVVGQPPRCEGLGGQGLPVGGRLPGSRP